MLIKKSSNEDKNSNTKYLLKKKGKALKKLSSVKLGITIKRHRLKQRGGK